MDDATSAITSIFLGEEEGTTSSFRGLSETIRAHGLFSSSTNGAAILRHAEGGREGRQDATDEVGRALNNWTSSISLLQPAGARADGTALDTLQKRLPPLLRTNGMTTMEAANRWLAEVYLEQHNARFAVAAAEEGTAFIPFVGELDNILCIEEERVAALDKTVRYEGRACKSRPTGTAITSPRAPSACSNTGTARSPCSTDRAKSPASMPTGP